MIKKIILRSFGPIDALDWDGLQNINIITGINSSGKTTVLKAIYAAVHSLEQYKRGKEPRSIKELISNKLYWTFQSSPLGRLVRKGSDSPLFFYCTSELNEEFSFEFGESTATAINKVSNTFSPIGQNSIFIPAKEVLSIRQAILRTRDEWKIFGFDDTYYDLAKAITPSTKGRNLKIFSEVRDELKNAIDGRIQFDADDNQWIFVDSRNRKFPIDLTAEGVKKLSIIDVLLGNHYLSKRSAIFIDEPESSLHPQLVESFMDIICSLSQKADIQFFIATHSYFVIKKMYLLANKNKMDIPILSFEKEGIKKGNVKDGIFDNPIVEESVKLYEEELSL